MTMATTRPRNTLNEKAAAAVAARTADAYSADRYGAEWPKVAAALLRDGWTPRQAEAIMRSKWARWAADAGTPTAAALLVYVRKLGAQRTAAVNHLVATTPQTMAGADLAGACEGEHIAEALDLLVAVSDGLDPVLAQNRARTLLAEIRGRL